CAPPAYRLDPYARVNRKGNIRLFPQKREYAPGFFAALFPLDAHVKIFRILAEDDEINALRMSERAGKPIKVSDRPHARVEIEYLSEIDIDTAKASANRRCERTLQCYLALPDTAERAFGQEYSFC